MTLKATLCIDDAVGEHRRALLDAFGRPFRLEIERWSERGARAKLDEVWWGRARRRLPGGHGWFVDLGLGADGVIEATKAAVTEGAMIPVRVKSEAWSDKGPRLSLADMPASTPRPNTPARHATPSADPFFAGVEIMGAMTTADARGHISAAIEDAMRVLAPLTGGGDISIEATRALTAIDVDAGGRAGPSGGAFILDLNLTAAEEAARQLALRSIGGLVVVDFLTMSDRKDRVGVAEAFRSALAKHLGRASDVAEISGMGLCEASIARRLRPAADALSASPIEREALDALRAIESEGWAARGARIRATVSKPAADWLEADLIDWRSALASRIGERWTLEAADRSSGAPEVWSLR